ncbi:hypothetical protein [Paenibacillus apis]|uniref:Uncharacterized protein n=1 Tax=Paenibacillus apis TaxID=1792174 RepID=A0A919Y8K6_9BACL|nr:hypothetical protein [Paenibacillus apis]GIO44508.1 hypothetical protein J41TS4_42660 [Paenibacillus apis]
MTDPAEHENELWKKYIRGELSPDLMMKLENLLERDDAVFAKYFEALTSLEGELPSIRDEAGFASEVLQCLPEAGLQGATRTYPDSRRQWINYGIAAAATILLLGGGFFDQMTSGVGASIGTSDPGKSISSKWMERAGTWMDDFKNEGKER